MAPVVIPLKLCRWHGSQGRMQIMLVVVRDPIIECLDQRDGAGPFLQPQALLFAGPYDSLCIRIARRVVRAGEGVMTAQSAASFHKGERGGVTPMITHPGQALLTNPL